jgi:hypothetical protein
MFAQLSRGVATKAELVARKAFVGAISTGGVRRRPS